MATEPEFAAFARAYELGQAQVLYTKRVADLETPVSAFLKLGEGRDNAFLFESVQGGETRGRYSIIGLKPDLIWRCRDGKSEINRNARASADTFVPESEAPIAASSRQCRGGFASSTSTTTPQRSLMGRQRPVGSTTPGVHGPAATRTWFAVIRCPSTSTPTARPPSTRWAPPSPT